MTALDVKDNYTARHSAAVALWATDIAQAMALSKHEQNITHLASLVHDVGKIGVPDEVLNFPGKLERDAWLLVETHCQNGHKILKTIDQFGELAEVILYHHERYDGSGYPVGLVGEAIPLISRIICAADSYSAMVSDRPYRKAPLRRGGPGRAAQARGQTVRPAGGGLLPQGAGRARPRLPAGRAGRLRSGVLERPLSARVAGRAGGGRARISASSANS